jgi:hypothetical protein
MEIKKKFGPNAELVWKDRRRRWGLPLSFTRYKLVKDKNNTWCKLFSEIGLLITNFDELNLYRVKDIALDQTLGDKIFGTGTITLYSNDSALPVFKLLHVAEPYKVRTMLSSMVEEQRALHGVKVAEFQGR